jgi:Ig-like domain from next to BRCA1 gene
VFVRIHDGLRLKSKTYYRHYTLLGFSGLRKAMWGILIFCSFALMSACAGRSVSPTFYIPPTGAPQAAPISIAATESVTQSPTDIPPPTPTPPCSPGLAFLEDLTIPDGTEAAPGESLDKRWRVENSGTCNWDQGYSLTLIGGQEMGAPTEQALFPARSGTEAVIRMIFTAPVEPGAYTSAWQARDPAGNLFGDPFFIEIVVLSN